MKTSSGWGALTLCAVGLVAAEASLFGDSPPGVLEVSFERYKRQHPVSVAVTRNGKRDKTTLQASFGDNHIVHVVNVTIGTPPQPVALVLDSGSSDLIVRSSPSSLCQEVPCVGNGVFNPKKSSTYKRLNSNFTSKFGSEADNSTTFAQGDVANETVTIGGLTVPNLQIAVVENATIPLGILGLGFPAIESQNQNSDDGKTYDNLPLALYRRNLVKDYGYTLWSEDPTAKKGSIIFGGYDTAKFSGKLQSLDILAHAPSSSMSAHIPADEITYLTFTVALGGVRLNGNPKDSKKTKRVYILPAATDITGLDVNLALVDSGTTLTFLPDQFISPILSRLEATYDESSDSVTVSCKYQKSKATVEFLFPGFSMKIPLRNFVKEVDYNACNLYLLPAMGRDTILGASFLGSVAATFDLEKHKIHFGLRDFSSKGSNIKQIRTLWDGSVVKGDGTTKTDDPGSSGSDDSGLIPTPSTGASGSRPSKSDGIQRAKAFSVSIALLVCVFASIGSLYVL